MSSLGLPSPQSFRSSSLVESQNIYIINKYTGGKVEDTRPPPRVQDPHPPPSCGPRRARAPIILPLSSFFAPSADPPPSGGTRLRTPEDPSGGLTGVGREWGGGDLFAVLPRRQSYTFPVVVCRGWGSSGYTAWAVHCLASFDIFSVPVINFCK